MAHAIDRNASPHILDTNEPPAVSGAGAPEETTIVETAKKTGKATRSIPGLAEYTPEEMALYTSWQETVQETFATFGFNRFSPPAFVTIDNLKKKGGLSHEMYGIYRLNGMLNTALGLPFDRTLPLAIWVAKNEQRLRLPYQRFDIGFAHRAERAQAGRFRVFHQCDVDVIDRGAISPYKEAECIGAMIAALNRLDIGTFTVYLNHLALPKLYIREAGISEASSAEALRILDKLDKLPHDEIKNQLRELHRDASDATLETLISHMNTECRIDDFSEEGLDQEAAEGIRHLRSVTQCLVDNDIDPSTLKIRAGMVRGLDYYTGLVFETFIDGAERLGSVASGGAYDNLVGAFAQSGESDIRGFGGSIGLTRLFDVMKREGRFAAMRRQVSPDVVVLAKDETLLPLASRAAGFLRKMSEKTCLLAQSHLPLKKQMQTVGKQGFPYAVIVLGEEDYGVKRLNDGVQINVSALEETPQAFRELRE